MIMSLKQRKIKIKPRIKLKHDIHVEKKPDVWGFRSFAFVPITRLTLIKTLHRLKWLVGDEAGTSRAFLIW